MTQRCAAAVLGSLAGDSLALGVHWNYDPARIAEKHGTVDSLLPPSPGSYHSGKMAGDFTHYGDQTLVLLKSVAREKGFSALAFAQEWQAFFADYAGYLDNATKTTLAMYEFGIDDSPSCSNSDDMAGACRIAPLLCAGPGDEDELVAWARAQTKATHNNGYVLDTAEFLARAMYQCAQGADVLEALNKAGAAEYASAPMGKWLEAGLASKEADSSDAIGAFGRTCHIDSAFPATVHLLAKYPKDLKGCLSACAMAGGDSAARALAAGMVLGAALGPEAIPQEWIQGLTAIQEIEALLAEVPD